MSTPKSTTRTLLAACREPQTILQLELSDWNWFLPAARLAGVFNRLATQAVERGLVGDIPEPVRWHLESAHVEAEHNRRTIAWELDRLARALASAAHPLLLLKGAAYVAAGLPPASGRIASDVDLLVPAADLDAVEQRLLASGWQAGETPPRDARYFRRWLHEIPPLVHHYRRTSLDLHHNVLPRTDRLAFDPAPLIEASVPAESGGRGQESGGSRTREDAHTPPRPADSCSAGAFRVLAPPDMVLHAMIHLFRNGDFTHGLRDLIDIDALIRHFEADSSFWDQFVQRTRELRLEPPVRLACRALARTLETPIPASVATQLGGDLTARGVTARLADRIVDRALFPSRLDGDDRPRLRAQWLLAHVPLPRPRAMLSPLFWLKRLPARAA